MLVHAAIELVVLACLGVGFYLYESKHFLAYGIGQALAFVAVDQRHWARAAVVAPQGDGVVHFS